MVKFTKGPWRWRDGTLLSAGGETVLEVHESHGGGMFASDEDESLIAAAPELYGVVEWIIECYGPEMSNEIRNHASRVLAKARGENG